MAKKFRVIIDTNLWISFLISNQYNQLDLLISSKNCTLIFSQALLDEFIEVARRPKLEKYFALSDLETLIKTINDFAVFINVTSKVEFLKDAKDDFLLSLSVDGNADYLITGDKELLEVVNYNETKIISITQFLRKFDIELK